MVLEPPWNRILTLDSVTLKCQGDQSPGDDSTQWLHNGTLISSQTSYFIKAASVENSGEYRCRTDLSELSDPVQLEVHVGEWAKGERGGSPTKGESRRLEKTQVCRAQSQQPPST